jgi:hypothetical protein
VRYYQSRQELRENGADAPVARLAGARRILSGAYPEKGTHAEIIRVETMYLEQLKCGKQNWNG